MALVDSVFNNICRIGNDGCDQTNKNLQNIKSANYLLENYNLISTMNNIVNFFENRFRL